MANKVVLSKTDFLAWLEDVGACSPATGFVKRQKDHDAEDIFNTAVEKTSGQSYWQGGNWLHWLGHRLPGNEICTNAGETITWKKVLEALGVK